MVIFIDSTTDDSAKYFKHVYDIRSKNRDDIKKIKKNRIVTVGTVIEDLIPSIECFENSKIVVFSSNDCECLERFKDRICLIGTKDVSEYADVTITQDKLNVFNKKDLEIIIEDFLSGSDVYVVLSGTFLDLNKDYFIRCNNVAGIGFCDNFSESERDKAVCGEKFRSFMKEHFEIQEKSLNIYDEQSRFLIFRPLYQESEEDYGWFILKNLSKDMKEDLLERVDKDKIIEIDIDDEEYLVTSTSVEEQNSRIYYFCNSITDIALYPQEKQNMIFDLIN